MNAALCERWHEIEPLLDRALDQPVAERDDWLRCHCRDETLRTLVAHALADTPAAAALERGTAQWLPAFADPSLDALPYVPGYRVLRFVGAGGMASVFEAERELPGGPQRVALKLLRIDVHDPQEQRRFLREQRILAHLSHPHIAQLLDAGFTPTGTPFLALEYIAGGDLLAHCERRGLRARARLALFADVCAAVEHAHRGLIVHRDLKPGNVLVDADGGVKLVDFGIAKLLTGETEATRSGMHRLTRAYAAPEQFAGDVATTAIDVYALGLLLAELISGRRPGRTDDATRAGSGADEATLRRALGADLHAIVREATQPDPVRRYASVAALREDIERHLDGRPLRARAQTFAYRASTLLRRHALALAVAATLAATLATATAISLQASQRAHLAAQQALAQAHLAHDEAARAQAVKGFLEGLFDSAAPGASAGETAEDLLVRGRERAERDFAAQPALRVEMLALIGDLERRSGHVQRAQAPLEAAAALAIAEFGATDRRSLHVEYLIAKQADELGRVRAATARLRSAIDAFEVGPNGDSPEHVEALAWLAGLYERGGESAQAIATGERTVALARRVLPDDSAALNEAVTNLGWIYMDAGRAERAEPLLREALARARQRLGPKHPELADTMALLNSALTRLGRYGEGEQLLREALAIDAAVYVRPHAHTAWHLNDLANVLVLEGRLAEARAAYEQSIAIDRATAPAAEVNEATTLANLARVRLRQGAYADAESGLRAAIDRKQQLFGENYADNGRDYDRTCLAEALIARGRLDEAQAMLDGALVEARSRHRTAHPDIAFALTVEAELAAARGARDRAAALAGEAVAIDTALADAGSDKAIRAQLLLGETLQELGRSGEARPPLERALAAVRNAASGAPTLRARIAGTLARVEAALGDAAAAQRLRAEAKQALASAGDEASVDRDLARRLADVEPVHARL